ncbi:MAG: LVIVD repeat-containing protein [Actinomycetota bacterium]
MKRLLALLSVLGMMLALTPAISHAGPGPYGVTSDNVQYVRFVPFEVGTATGSRLIGRYLYVTSWRSFSIYDTKPDPTNPTLLSLTPFAKDATTQGDPARFENEDVSTNGKFLVFSETTPRSILYIYDVEDKTNPTLLSQTSGLGEHTMSCILHCHYLLGSSGSIIDVHDPAKPKKIGDWLKELGFTGGAHDVTEVKNGFALDAPLSGPFHYFDIRDPLHPKLLAQGARPASDTSSIIHSIAWPRQGKDRYILVQEEKNFQPQCGQQNGGFLVFDTKGWQKTHTFTEVSSYKAVNGDIVDGNPPANALGCSAHWFEARDDFHNGGIVADGFYEHGSKFFNVDSKTGKLTVTGWYEPYGGSTSADHWVNHKIVYAIDYSRGFDILEYDGK